MVALGPAGDTSHPCAGLPVPAPRGPEFLRGIALDLLASDPDPAVRHRIYRNLLDEIRATGATDVLLPVRWAMATVRDTTLAPRPGLTPSDAELAAVVGDARARGLGVFLMPIVHVETRRLGRWRGTLEPADWDRWWEAYTRFVLHYAAFAEAHGISLFSVGSELSSTEHQRARWRHLIAEVRGVYSGQLTYSANWDHFEPIGFVDALDFAGVSTYPTLSTRPDPSEAELDFGWKSFTRRLVRWAKRHGRPVLLTEVGFPSAPHAAARPWDHRPPERADPALQLRCYRSLVRTFHAAPYLRGLFVWNWLGFDRLDDASYSPRGKPAAEVIRCWYGALAAGNRQARSDRE